MKKILFFLIGLSLVAASCSKNTGTTPAPTQPAPETPAPQTQTFENSKLKMEIANGWTASAASSNPTAVNITRGKYILYINVNASQASGVEGGRFAEIAAGSPSADAVVTVQPSNPCGTSEKTFLYDIYSRVDLYVSASDKKEYCAVPTNNSNAWYFSYITTTSDGYFIHDWGSDPSNLVITLSFNSKIVNDFPVKGSSDLNSAFADTTQMIKSLKLQTIK